MNPQSQTRTVAGTGPTAKTIRDTVTLFLARFVDDVSVLAQEHLLTSGLLDSLAAVEMIAMLERRFGLEIVDADLEIENFDSVSAVVAFVLRKQAS